MVKRFLSFLLVSVLIGTITLSQATTFTVNNATDIDNGLSDNNPAASNSLRKVIRLVNAAGVGPHVINFSLSSPYTITISSDLPAITKQVTIDGTSQPGYAGTPLVVLTGGYHMIELQAGSSIVKSLNIANVYSDVTSGAIKISSASSCQVLNNIITRCRHGVYLNSSNGTIIKGNRMGTTIADVAGYGNVIDIRVSNSDNTVIGSGTSGEGNLLTSVYGGPYGCAIRLETGSDNTVIKGNKLGSNGTDSLSRAAARHGIWATSGTTGTVIGGSAAGEGNLISGHNGYGIYLKGTGSVTIKGNKIGTNLAGTGRIQNYDGIVCDGASNVTIGGTAAGEGNLISGNQQKGIWIRNSCNTVTVLGNKIGVDVNGTAKLYNKDGIALIDSIQMSTYTENSQNVVIGGGAAGSMNVISGNSSNGIWMYKELNTPKILGNRIGLNSAGTAALANKYGFFLDNCKGKMEIGGIASGEGNVISGNLADGMYLFYTDSITVKGNYIGTNASGTSAIANQGNGIFTYSSQVNTIGGSTSAYGNVISGNGNSGVAIYASSYRNVIKNNKIGTNAAGTAAVGNTADGVNIYASADYTQVDNNQISGNHNGIYLSQSAYVKIRGNKIGTDYTGMSAIANANGIYVYSCSNNDIGGSGIGEGNQIAGNTNLGLAMESTSYNTVYGNRIGVKADGNALGNGEEGIRVTSSSYHTIGGAGRKANIIANNTLDGVNISSAGNVEIRKNSIYANGDKSIELNYTLGNQGNAGKAIPVITGVSYTQSTRTVVFSGTSAANDSIELFNSESTGKNAYYYLAQGKANGSGSWSVTIYNFRPSSNYFVATATSSTTKETSQLSAAYFYEFCSSFGASSPVVSLSQPANFNTLTQLTATDQLQWTVNVVPTLNPPVTDNKHTVIIEIAAQIADPVTGALVPDWANRVQDSTAYVTGVNPLSTGTYVKIIDDLIDQQDEAKTYFWRIGIKYLLPDPTTGLQSYTWSDLYNFRLNGKDKVIPAASYLAAEDTNATTHTNKINWVYEVTYLDDSKTNQVITYMDGLGLTRQSQTLLNTANKIMCAETAYSEEGGGSVQSMAAPINATQFGYSYRFFDVNIAGVYSDFATEHFDREIKYTSSPNALMTPVAVDNTAGVGYYYSASNTMESYVDDAQGYPYAYSVGYKDPLGRVQLSGGVGDVFKVTGGKETKSFTTGVSTQELARVYGTTKAATMTNITKDVVTDANGVSSFTYTDMEGKVIATALSGCSADPLNQDALNEGGMTGFTSKYNVLGNDKVNKDNLERVSNANFFVPCGGSTVSLHYEIDLGTFGTGTATCENCVYDLRIRVIEDATGFVVYDSTQKLPTTPPVVNCSTAVSNYVYNKNVTVPRGGTYSVYRILKPYTDVTTGKTVVQQAVDNYVNTLYTDIQTQRNTFKDELYSEDSWYALRKLKTGDTRTPNIRRCISRYAGIYGTSGSTDATRLSATLGNSSQAIDTDTLGNIYFVDSALRIRKINGATGMVTTLLNATSLGYSISDICVDDAGANIYFTDTNPTGKIRKLITSTSAVSDLYTAKTDKHGIEYYKGLIYFRHSSDVTPASKSNISCINTSGTLIKANYVTGTAELPFNNNYNGGNADPSLVVLKSSSGKEMFYFARSADKKVHEVSSTGTYRVFAGSTGTGAVDGPALSARFASPKGIALDKDNNLFVSDVTAIRRIDAGTGMVTTYVGNLSLGGVVDGPTDTATVRSSQNWDLIFDKGGNLYLTDLYSIRKISDCGKLPTCPELLPSVPVTYNSAPPVKLTLQPGSEGKDATIFSRSDQINTNLGSQIQFVGCSWTWSGDPGTARGMIQYDLSSIPSGAYIVDARLSLYSKTGLGYATSGHSGSNAGWLERITQNWNENTVTWNNQPTTTTTNRVSIGPSASQYQSFENIDVTTLVRDMVANPSSSFGFMMKLQTEATYRQLLFASGDHTDPTIRPKLEILYAPIPPAGGCAALGTLTDYATVTIAAVPGPLSTGGTAVNIGQAKWKKGMTAQQFTSALVKSINTNSLGTNTMGFVASNIKGGSYVGDSLNTMTVTAPYGSGDQYNGWQLQHTVANDATLHTNCFKLDIGTSNIGTELQVNGDFSATSGGWYSYGPPYASLITITPPNISDATIYTGKILTPGKRYRMSFDLSGSSPNLSIEEMLLTSGIPGFTNPHDFNLITSAGSYTFDFYSQGHYLRFNLGGTLDNVSIKEVDQLVFKGGFDAGQCNEYLWYADKVDTNNIVVGGTAKVEIVDLDGKAIAFPGDERDTLTSFSGPTTLYDDAPEKANFLQAYERMHWAKIKESDVISMQSYTVSPATLPALLDNKNLVKTDMQSFVLMKVKFRGPSCEDKCKAKEFPKDCDQNCEDQLKSLDFEVSNAYTQLSSTTTQYFYSGSNRTLTYLTDNYYPLNNTLINLVDSTDNLTANASHPAGLNLYLAYESSRLARESFDKNNCLKACNGDITSGDKCTSCQENYRSCVYENINELTAGQDYFTSKWDAQGSFPYADSNAIDEDERGKLGILLSKLLVSYFKTPASYPRVPVRAEWDETTAQNSTSCSNCGSPSNATYGCSAGTPWDVTNFPDVLLTTLVSANANCVTSYNNCLDMSFDPVLSICKQNNANCKAAFQDMNPTSQEYLDSVASCNARFNCVGSNPNLAKLDSAQRIAKITEVLGNLYINQDTIRAKTTALYTQTRSMKLQDFMTYMFDYAIDEKCRLDCSQYFETAFKQWMDQKILTSRNYVTSQFMSVCFNRNEKMEVSYSNTIYHYTLFNYNAGNDLVSTVPPEGVDYVNIEDPNPTNANRVPNHRMLSTYTSDTEGKVSNAYSPDDNNTKYLYDKAGRVRFTQTDEQVARGTAQSKVIFSYVKLDPETERTVEVGEYSYAADALGQGFINPTPGVGSIYASDKVDDPTWPTDGNRTIEESYFYYDQAYLSLTGYVQENLHNRVSKMSNVHGNSYYSYDKHGRLKFYVQEILDMEVAAQRFKTTDYEYKPMTSQVTKMVYQKGNTGEEFSHRITYNQDNWVTLVEISRNGTTWEKASSYDFYLHGTPKATGLGDDIQRLNYVYNLQGWLKAINHPLQGSDPGQDGISGTFAKDVFGEVLNYYSGDYKLTGKGLDASSSITPQSGTYVKNKGKDLYNGTITSTVTYTGFDQTASAVNPLLAQGFRYDQLNRLVGSFAESQAVTGFTGWTNSGTGLPDVFQENMTYDANGNITALTRTASNRVVNGSGGATTALDNMSYKYDQSLTDFYGVQKKANNKLNYIDDAYTTDDALIDDVLDQASGNYAYDANGRLIQDLASEIQTITWYPDDKVKEIIRTSGSSKPRLQFTYDATGQRISKKVIKSTTDSTQNYTVYYSYDAAGSQMGMYEKRFTSQTSFKYTITEELVYGKGRIGTYKNGNVVYNGGAISTTLTKSQLYFEVGDHLGNVRAVVTGVKTGAAATIVNLSDYYPFGMEIAERQFTSQEYRFGFNGMEKDDEAKGLGNSYTTEFRQYDPRIGRWMSPDPLASMFVDETPYSFVLNDPLNYIDPLGLSSTTPGGPKTGSRTDLKHNKIPTTSSSKGSGGNFIAIVVEAGMTVGKLALQYGSTIEQIAGSNIQILFRKKDYQINVGETLYIPVKPKSSDAPEINAVMLDPGKASCHDSRVIEDNSFTLEEKQQSEENISAVNNFVIGCTPVGVLADFYTLCAGHELGSKQELTWGERISGMIPYISESRKVKKALNLAKKTKTVKKVKKLWKLTAEGATAVRNHKTFGKMYKCEDGLWWSVDNAGHGGSKYKVFKETSKGLEWYKDADEYGDFIEGKHKGPTGSFIPWDQLTK